MTELLALMVNIGGADPATVTLSHSTIDRRMKEARLDARLNAQYQDFARRVTIHFDGVRAKLGGKQGNSVKEHIALTLTGEGQTNDLGIIVVERGRGEPLK